MLLQRATTARHSAPVPWSLSEHPESQQDAWRCAHRMQLGLSILKWPLGPTGSVRSTRSWEGGQVHPAPLPLHCFWACSSEMALPARSTSCRKSASPGQGCPAEGSPGVSSACVPAERHGYISHSNAKPQACCKCRGIVISHGGLID